MGGDEEKCFTGPRDRFLFFYTSEEADVMKSPALKPKELEFKFRFYLVYMQPWENAGCAHHNS